MPTNPIYSKEPSEFWQGESLALAKAIRKNNVDSLKFVVQKYAIDLNKPGNGGMTFLLWSCSHRHLEATRALLELGADPNQNIVVGKQVNDTYQLVSLLAEGDQYDLLNLVLDHGGDPNSLHGSQPALHCAIDNDKDRDSGKFDNMLLLIDKGADINRVDHSGYTPVMYAASANQYIAVEILLNKGATITNVGRLGLTLPHIVEMRLEELKDQPTHTYYLQILQVKRMLEQRGVKFPLPSFTVDPKTGIRQYAPIIINKK